MPTDSAPTSYEEYMQQRMQSGQLPMSNGMAGDEKGRETISAGASLVLQQEQRPDPTDSNQNVASVGSDIASASVVQSRLSTDAAIVNEQASVESENGGVTTGEQPRSSYGIPMHQQIESEQLPLSDSKAVQGGAASADLSQQVPFELAATVDDASSGSAAFTQGVQTELPPSAEATTASSTQPVTTETRETTAATFDQGPPSSYAEYMQQRIESGDISMIANGETFEQAPMAEEQPGGPVDIDEQTRRAEMDSPAVADTSMGAPGTIGEPAVNEQTLTSERNSLPGFTGATGSQPQEGFYSREQLALSEATQGEIDALASEKTPGGQVPSSSQDYVLSMRIASDGALVIEGEDAALNPASMVEERPNYSENIVARKQFVIPAMWRTSQEDGSLF
jgi:hypothetical protein